MGYFALITENNPHNCIVGCNQQWINVSASLFSLISSIDQTKTICRAKKFTLITDNNSHNCKIEETSHR